MRAVLLLIFTAGCAAGPQSGTWLYTSTDILSDSCGFLEDEDLPEGDFYVYNEGKGSLVVDPNDGSDIFNCTLDGKSFDCPSRLEDEQSQGNTTLRFEIGVVGEFDGRESVSGSQNAEVDCEGDNCATVEATLEVTFPCTAEVGFTADWTSPTLPE